MSKAFFLAPVVVVVRIFDLSAVLGCCHYQKAVSTIVSTLQTMLRASAATVLAFLGCTFTEAFTTCPLHSAQICRSTFRLHETTTLFERSDQSDDWETMEEDAKTAKVDAFLNKFFPAFSEKLLNDNVRKAIAEGSVTVFAPTDKAFEKLGEKKLSQLEDPRNDEIRDKMGSYHCIPERAISAMELRTEDWSQGRPKDGSPPNTVISAVVSLSGEVPVGRSKSGGFLNFFGAKEDGDIVIGPEAKIVKSFNVQDCIVHEMDALVSPDLLWRYCDQLRIPGF